MAEDLMNTQTGGPGETIQLQPEVQTTPEQFDVKINPPVDSEPVSTETPAEVATVPTQEQAKVEPIAIEQPVIDEPREMMEEEPVSPPVTREGMVEVSLNDDADTQSAIQDLGIPTQAPSMISEVEEPAELDLSGYTIDGAEQHQNIIPVIEEEVKEGPSFETIDLSKYTIDGSEQAIDPEVKKQENIIKKEYANTPVTIDDKGRVKVQTKPKAPVKKEDGELFTYKERPGAIYKRKGPNDWYVDPKGDGNFVKIVKNAKSRIAELEKNAVRVGTEKPKTFTEVNKAISEKHGNVNSKFTEHDMLTSGGDPIITKGLNFSQLTKSNKPSKTDMYTNSGQINFNYDPEYAKATKEQRALLDLQKSKPEGMYRFPGSDDLYKKVKNDWLKDVSGKGTKFVALTKGDVAKRKAALEAQAIPLENYNLATSVMFTIVNNPLLKSITAYDVLKLGGSANVKLKVDTVQEIEDKFTFDQAKNFAEKDLVQMFARNNTFSGKQLTDMLEIQKQAKQIIGDGTYDPIKAKSVEGLLNDLNEYFDQAKAINEKVNTAYSKNMSLSRLLLEEKRKDYNDILTTTSSTSDIQDAAKETFESTLKMVDFIQDAVDDGKMLYDREKGGFKFSTNTTKTEREYYEKQLGKYLNEYNQTLSTRFESINEEIIDLKGTMRGNLAKISSIKDRMSKLNSDSQEYKDLSKDLWELTSENKKIDKDIANRQSLKSTVFHTEPKKLVASLKPTTSAQIIFNAIPEGISPKQKFDLFYKQLIDKNNRLEKENNIDGKSLAGKFSQFGRELLDWGGYFSLTDAEKEWMNNKAMLNQLSPLYFNNDFGFTETSGGFYDSFVNAFGQLLAPKASRAQGHINQSEAANTIMNTLAEQGFNKDDIVDANYLKALKDKSNVDFWSREQFGGMGGTTFGIIGPLIVTKKIPSSSLRLIGRVENLVTKTKNAENIALFLTRAENVFDSTLKATKYGKYLVNPIKTGLEYEATGRIFKSTQDEMYFLSGFTGGIASEAFAGVISKLPANKAYAYMKSMFGGQTDRAVNVIKKIGELNTRGIVETAEEFGNELSNIYTDELRTKGFFEEVKSQFGDLDKVQEFVISTFIMGSAFGLVDSSKKRAAYDSLPPEKKAQVDEVLNAIRGDMQSAEENVDKYVNEQTEEVERKQEFEKEPQKEVKTNDTGDIEFDVENIKEAADGRPSVVAESKEEPSSFTEPVDLNELEQAAEKGTGFADIFKGSKIKTYKTKQDVAEDEAGIPSEEQVGEEPVEAQPVAEAGKEEVSPGGVVQEEQKVTPKVYVAGITDAGYESITDEEGPGDIRQKISYQTGENRGTEIIEGNDGKTYATAWSIRGGDDKRIRDVARRLGWISASVEVKEGATQAEIDNAKKLAEQKLNNILPSVKEGKLMPSMAKEALAKLEAVTAPVAETKVEKEQVAVKEAAPATTTMFNEASDISKIKNRTERLEAEKAFEEKHGMSHKKVSNINTNFARIVKGLENNNLIEKEC